MNNFKRFVIAFLVCLAFVVACIGFVALHRFLASVLPDWAFLLVSVLFGCAGMALCWVLIRRHDD